MKVWEIIRVLEESPICVESSDLDLDVVFRTTNGFRFSVFFDCDEPDYVNWIEPVGEDRIDFWLEGAPHVAAYLAGNLIALPHVRDRLKEALVRFHSD